MKRVYAVQMQEIYNTYFQMKLQKKSSEMKTSRHFYRAMARPSRPATPAKLIATPAVATGAPPVEVAVEAEPEAVDVSEEEVAPEVAVLSEDAFV